MQKLYHVENDFITVYCIFLRFCEKYRCFKKNSGITNFAFLDFGKTMQTLVFVHK